MAIITVNRRALKHNLKRLREIAPNSKIIAIVKANAYGHGILETARTLYDADAFGVARLEEALILRDGGIMQPILLLEGFFSTNDLFTISSKNFQTAIHNIEQIKALEMTKLNKPIIVWMKLDIGMHRLGVRQEQNEIFYKRLINCKNIQQPINIVSHFSHANEIEYCSITEKQLYEFNNFCKDKPGLRSVASSSSILLQPQSHLDWIRPGIILYGISPLKDKKGTDFGFKPVMSFTSKLIAIRKHKAGESVGYGGTWISKKDTILGVVAIGYGDGYPYMISSGTPVLTNGREVNIVGRVTMDMMCVDLGPTAKDQYGDSVILWGEDLPIERVAEIANINVYELVTRLTSRVTVNYLD